MTKDLMVIYQGRSVSRDGFRAYVYGKDGAKKLVNSWKEYEDALASSLWFSLKEEALVKSKPARVKREAPVKEEEVVVKED